MATLTKQQSQQSDKKQSIQAVGQDTEPLNLQQQYSDIAQKARFKPGRLTPDNVALLQRTLGNQAIGQLVNAMNKENDGKGKLLRKYSDKESSGNGIYQNQHLPLSASETNITEIDSVRPPILVRNKFTTMKSVIARQEETNDPTLDRLTRLSNVMYNTLQMPALWYQNEIDEIRPILGRVLGKISNNFENAWGQHNRILQNARLDAEDENMVRGIAIGAAASLLLAVVSEFAILAAGFKAFSGGWWAIQGASVAGETALGAEVSGALQAATNFSPMISSELGQIRQLIQLLYFERTASMIHRTVSNVARQYMNVETIIDEIREGRKASVQAEADEFIRRARQIEVLPGNYMDAWQRARRIKEQLQNYPAPSTIQMERAIWVNWIAHLSDHDLLDRDAVEDYLHGRIGILGEGSLLGVDTREIFDTDKEQAAIRNAQSRKHEIFQQLSAPRLGSVDILAEPNESASKM